MRRFADLRDPVPARHRRAIRTVPDAGEIAGDENHRENPRLVAIRGMKDP
jgi:hypothetical protein